MHVYRLYFIYVHIAWLQVGQLALHVHVAKTNSILLRPHRKSTPVITESLQINKISIPYVLCVNFFGIQIGQFLSWKGPTLFLLRLFISVGLLYMDFTWTNVIMRYRTSNVLLNLFSYEKSTV